MSLRIGVQIQVCQMDGTEVAQATLIDTAINPNPVDPTAEAVLAQQMVGRLAEQAAITVNERLGEYNQALARLLS